MQWRDRLIVPGCAGLQPAGMDEASMLVEDGRPAACLHRAPPGNSYTRSSTVDLACWTSRAAVLIHRIISRHHAIWCRRRGLCGGDSQSRLRSKARPVLSTRADPRRQTSGSRVHASAICPPHRLQRPPPQFSFALKKKARSRKLSSPCVLGDCLRGAGPSAISTSAEALPPPVRPH